MFTKLTRFLCSILPCVVNHCTSFGYLKPLYNRMTAQVPAFPVTCDPERRSRSFRLASNCRCQSSCKVWKKLAPEHPNESHCLCYSLTFLKCYTPVGVLRFCSVGSGARCRVCKAKLPFWYESRIPCVYHHNYDLESHRAFVSCSSKSFLLWSFHTYHI